ncbi:MAG: CBS domain-containing protein [Gemmatimonadota bacterium]|nr:MAG: CBS domain-containing protein [Gemmatimonadota bacterium]
MRSRLTISRLLGPDLVIVGLKAKTFAEAVGQLLDRLEKSGAISDRSAVDALVEEGVVRGETPMLGKHAILAHYRTEAANRLGLAIGVSAKPFKFPSLAPGDATLLVLIITPRAATREYLKTLAGVGRLLHDPENALTLSKARSPQDVLALIEEKDVEVHPDLRVVDLMSHEFQTVSPETPLSEALRLMVRQGRREMPVVSDNGEVLGILSEQEVLQHFLPQVLGAAPLTEGDLPKIKDVEVRNVMQRSVLCLTADELMSDVVSNMLAGDLAQFPVVRKGKLVGILSRSDILTKLLDTTV